ncbi:CG5592, partial [Drosophila busckii]
IPPNTENCLTFDDILVYVGEFGRYQKCLFCCMIPFEFIWCTVYLSQIFTILVPDHWCRIPELSSLSKEDQLKLAIPNGDSKKDFDRCRMYDVNYTQLLEDNVSIADKDWPKKHCNDWVYDKKQVPYDTIAMQYNWVCDDYALGAYTVTIYFVGSIVGAIIFGYTTDHCGRIPALMLANTCGLVGGVLSAFCKGFSTFAGARFVVGMAYDYCCTPIYILIMEIVGPKYRTFITQFTIAVFFTPIACLLPWLAILCNDWRIFTLATSIPIACALILYFAISESPRWLISAGKIDKGMAIIRKAAKRNGKNIPEDVLVPFEKCCHLIYAKEQTRNQNTVIDLFRTWRRCRITFILILIWMITSLVYDAHVRIITDLGPDIFITFSVACTTELPAGLLPLFLLDVVGRRNMTFAVFIICAIGSLAAGFLENIWLVATAAIIGRFGATIAYNIGLQWAAEILPTVVRGQGVALVHIMGFVASLMSPLVVYLEHYSKIAPMMIISGLSIIAVILAIFLPETKNIELPQTLQDAESMW